MNDESKKPDASGGTDVDDPPAGVPAGPLRPPSALTLLKEIRAVRDLVRMVPALLRVRPGHAAGDDPAPVMVLPGFGAGDLSTLPLRSFLRRNGFAVEGWGLGANRAGLDLPHGLADISPGWAMDPKEPYRRDGGVAYLSDLVGERVTRRVAELGRPLPSSAGASVAPSPARWRATIRRQWRRSSPWARP